VSNASARFDREVENSRLLVQAAELEAETLGPRSIAQVRREKAQAGGLNAPAASMQLQKPSTMGGAEPPNHLNNNSSNSNTSNMDSNNNSNGSDESGSLRQEGGAQPIKSPTSVQDLADIAAQKHGLVVAAVWACRWEGKLRWGMHKISSLSFVGESVCAVGGDAAAAGASAGATGPTGSADSSNISRGKSSGSSLGATSSSAATVGSSSVSGGGGATRPASDFLLVGLHHLHSAVMHSGSGGNSSSTTTCRGTAAAAAAVAPFEVVTVPVQVQLRSLSHEALSVTVTALEWTAAGGGGGSVAVSSSSTSSSSSSSSSSSGGRMEDGSADRMIKRTSRGIQWGGKTKHIAIPLPAKSERSIFLEAVITEPGVYDLNRLRISVRYDRQGNSSTTTAVATTTASVATTSVKSIPGQSLISVVSVAPVGETKSTTE